ncbi:MAG: CBS domain-containing protein [Nitrospirota bacterium]
MKEVAPLPKEKISIIQELAYDLKVGDVMKKEVITVSPHNLISDLRNILRDNRISGTPVVDEQGKLMGIISIEDFIKCLATEDVHAVISSKMTKKVDTLYKDEPLVHAINRFDKVGYGRFPVIERENGKLVGIITKGDIIHGLLQRLENEFYEEEIKRFRASHIFEDIIADETTLRFQYKVIGQDFSQAGRAASGLKKTLTRLGIPPPIIRRISIATYEAEMNIVIYTQGGEITACVQSHQIKVSVKDTGPGIPDIKKAMQQGFSTAPEWVRELGFGAGMGLNNIHRCSDKMILKSKMGKGTQLKIFISYDSGIEMKSNRVIG